MQGKNVLVTGGASGIGFGICSTLAKRGANIIISDLNADAAENAAATIREAGGNATVLVMNVCDPEQVEQLASYAQENPIDVLVNNAGIQHVSKLEDFPRDKWQLLIDVMLVAPAMLSQAVLPSMRANGYGRIINIGSVHSLVASPFKSAYVAAKHGLIGFSKVMALETADTDITINTVCPAYVKTPLVEQQIADQAKNHGISEEEVVQKIMLEPMPKKSFIDLEEIAETVAFLSSSGAKNITGQTMVLDGGWTAK